MIGTRPPIDGDWHATVTDWLAGVFAMPLSVASVESFRKGQGSLLLEALDYESGCNKGANTIRQALMPGETAEAAARRFGGAFSRLFEGVGGPRTVSPFESAHVSLSGRLFQAPSAAMKRMLRRAQLTPATGDREPVDHISVELALLARLMRRGASEGEQLTLLNDHLLVWVPNFAQAIEHQDSTGFYAGAASILSGFLLERRQALAAPLPGISNLAAATGEIS